MDRDVGRRMKERDLEAEMPLFFFSFSSSLFVFYHLVAHVLVQLSSIHRVQLNCSACLHPHTATEMRADERIFVEPSYSAGLHLLMYRAEIHQST